MSHDATPGRPRGRSGVLLSTAPARPAGGSAPAALSVAVLTALVGLTVGLAGCEAVGGGATLQLDTTEVRLEGGATIHDVHVGGAGATDSIAPDSVMAAPGDVVRFIATDHRTHALVFDAAALATAPREFLERTQQLRGPPLVNRDAAWAVSLEEAPPGRYPFFCRSHDAGGVLTVR